MKIKLAIGVDHVLQLDDIGMRAVFQIEARRTTTKHVYLTLTRAGADLMAGDLDARTAGGWDQPNSWSRSSRVASDVIRAALKSDTEADGE